MSEDLSHELQAIAAIYGDDTMQKVPADGDDIYTLSLKQHHVTLRLSFPPDYPAAAPPELQGIESVGSTVRKGHGSYILATARQALSRIFAPGQVCLFDLIQVLEEALVHGVGNEKLGDNIGEGGKDHEKAKLTASTLPTSSPSINQTPTPTSSITNLPPSSAPPEPNHMPPPTWTLSTTVTEKKSVFLARACSITSPAHAQNCIAHLLETDRRAAKATHNITAYRIQTTSAETAGTAGTAGKVSELTFQDCDDDGESAAGGRVLHLLQLMDAWGVLIVVSRWFGGVKLGSDRFRIINQVVREVIVKGNWGKAGKEEAGAG